MFLKATEGYCASLPLLSCAEQADYKDDDGNDDCSASGLRRSSCRGVERCPDNQPVYSRKGTLWIIKVEAAEWSLTCVRVIACALVYVPKSLQALFRPSFPHPFCNLLDIHTFLTILKQV